MRTATLEEILGERAKFGPRSTAQVVDLYAGVGGFSTGAELAGHTVRVAVDGWAEAMTWHSQNHRNTEHYCYWLPDPRLLQHLPPPRTRWHLHGSPPCTLLSKVHNTKDHRMRWDEGLDNIRYYLDLVLSAEPASWTMEQVDNGVVVKLLDEYVHKYPDTVAYEVVKMEEYGVPQGRKRLIAGSPWIIRRLCDKRGTIPRKRARDACSTIPPDAVGIKGQRQNKGSGWKSIVKRTPGFQKPCKKIAMVDRIQQGGLNAPAPTVVCSNSLMWARRDGFTIRCLTPREHADYQTFPTDYKFPDTNRLYQTFVGNSVPPAFAKVLMSDYRLPLERHLFPDPDFPPRPPSPCAQAD